MRPITQNDFDDVYEIYMDKNNNPFLLYEIMDKKSFTEPFKKLLGKDMFVGFDKGNELIGMCSCTYGEARISHVAEIGTLAFKEEHKGNGYAKEFVTKIIEHLSKKGFKRIELLVDADNSKAQTFYTKLGFNIDGRLPKYFKRPEESEYIDNIMMSKLF